MTHSLARPAALATGLASLLSFACPGANAATAAAQPLVLSGPHVVTYAQTPPVLGAAREIVQGVSSAPGACSITLRYERPADGTPMSIQELAFDPDTCRSLVQYVPLVDASLPTPTGASSQGVVDAEGRVLIPPPIEIDPTWSPNPNDYTTEAQAADGAAEANTDTSDLNAIVGGDTPTLLAAVDAATRLKHVVRFAHAYYADPPGIHVNDVIATVDYTTNGSCALPPRTTARMSAEWDWFTLTGWSLKGHGWDHVADCSHVQSNVRYSHFFNRAFCAAVNPILAFFPTDTYYQPVRVEGLPSGAAIYEMTMDKSGPCSLLLSARTETS